MDLELVQKLVEEEAIKRGEHLANTYFGPGGEKGFRWGYILLKSYRSVADKCNKFEQLLTSCTPIKGDYSPSCVAHCIIIIDDTNNSCYQKEDCDYPEEATCILDQHATLNATCV